jgi:hypothetical protein
MSICWFRRSPLWFAPLSLYPSARFQSAAVDIAPAFVGQPAGRAPQAFAAQLPAGRNDRNDNRNGMDGAFSIYPASAKP